YLLDQERKIRWLCVNDLSVGRNTGEVLRVLAGCQCGELCPANWKPGQATIMRPRAAGKAAPWETKERPALRLSPPIGRLFNRCAAFPGPRSCRPGPRTRPCCA